MIIKVEDQLLVKILIKLQNRIIINNNKYNNSHLHNNHNKVLRKKKSKKRKTFLDFEMI